MKKILKEALAIFLTVQLLAYIFTAFVTWKLSPGTWTESTRFCVAFIGLLVGLSAAGSYFGFKTEMDENDL